MPRKKSVTEEPKKKMASKSRAKMVNRAMEHKMPMPAAVCRTCHALPVGSIELMSLLLVLVFSLTAVLVTSVHANALQQEEIESLRTHVSK